MSSGDIGSSHVKFRVFVGNWIHTVSLMETTIAVSKHKLAPSGELAFCWVWGRHSLRDHLVQHVFGTTKIGFTSLITILSCLTNAHSTAATSSPEKYQKLVFLRTDMLIQGCGTSIETFC